MVRCYSNGLTKCKINNSEVKSLPVKSVPFKNAITGNSNSILFPSVNFQTFQSIKSFILCLLLLMAGIGSVNGATITASVSGNWNTQGTWVGNTVPAIGDDVVINSGVIVTVTANAPCKSLTFVAGTGGTLIVNNSFTLTVSNSVTMNIADIANTTSFISGAGSLTCSSVNIGNGTTINYNTTFTQTLTSTISAFTITGNLNLNSTMPRYDTTRNALFIETSGTVTVNGQIVTSNTYGNTSTFKLGDTSPTLYLGGVSPFSISGNGSSLITLSGVNATVNYNMNGAQSVYGINYTHLTLSGSGLKTLQTGTTVIGGNFTLSGTATTVLVTNVTIGGDLYISNGTTLDLSVFSANRSTLGGTLTVAGTMLLGSSSGGQSGSNFPANYASINLTGGTVNYNQSWGSQTIYSAPTYSNLILGNTSNPQTPGGNLTVIGTLTTAAGGSLDMGTYTLSVGNPNNAGIIKTQNISSAPITSSGGTWGGTVIYNGASVQTILTSAFNNLTVDNGSNGALLGGNIVVNGTLTLNGGQLTLGNYNLTMGGSASAVGGFNMMVKNNGTGSFRKIFTVPGSYIFPVADAAGTMSYVTINFASGTFAPNAYASAQVYNTMEPNILNTTTYLNKYWTIGQSGITGFSCTVTANYNNWSGGAGDIAGSGTNLYTAEFAGSAWTTSSSLASPLTATGVTAFGDFTGILQPITVTPASLSGFTYAHGSTPVEQSFTVSGANLSSSLTITPPADYEISTTSGTGYQSTPVTFSPSGGNVSPRTIYVRFKVATPVGTFSENIGCSSGSSTQYVALSGSVTSSVTYYSIATGNWNANTTWSTTSGGSAVSSGVFPLGGDNVVIERGYTVTVAANASCSSVTIRNINDGNSILTISGTNSLTVSGAFAMNLPGSGFSYNVNVSAGTLTAGSLTMSATTTTTDNITVSTGNLIVAGTYTSSGISNKLNLSGAGTIDFQGTTTLTGNPTLSTASGSTVRYSWSGAQTCIPATYSNLTLAGTSAKTTTTSVIVNGILSMEGDGTVSVSALPTYAGTTTLQYKGSAAQTTGTEFPATFPGIGLIINNPNGVTLNAAKSIKTLTLTNGILITSGTNLLSVTNTIPTSISGGSATSFVSGPVNWSIPTLATGTTYNFPVGKSGTFLPFSLVNPITTGAVAIQVEAFASGSGGKVDSLTIGGISNTEYWSWSTSGNFTNSSVSAYRPSTVSPYSSIGSSITLAGNYVNLGGTPGIYSSGGTTSYGISNSNPISGNTRFFVYGQQPSLWLKADAGTSTTTDGSGITTWNDQSGTLNNATAQLTSPTYQSMGWNFNPNIIFNTGYFLSAFDKIYNDMTFFAVYNSTQNNTSLNFYSDPAIIGGETIGTTNDYTLGTNGGALFFKGLAGNTYGAQTSSTYNDNYPKIVSVTRQKSATGIISLYVNGGTPVTAASDNTTLSDPHQIGIGNNFGYNVSSQFVGGICEVLGKQKVYSTGIRQNFESYLALKYGITISHDYTGSDSTVVYSIAGYGYDIAGLGSNTDISYGLSQKISSSSNFATGSSKVIMATNNDFISSNLTGRTPLSNGQYLIWGHNNLATTHWIPAAVASLDSTVNRIWKVQNTGNVGPVYFQIDLTGYPVPVTGYYSLFVDTNTDFSSGSVSYLLTNTSGNLYTATGVSFPSGTSYFTIAPKRNYWIGAASSTSWGVASNWTAGVIPPTGTNVEFATAANNIGVPAINDLQLDQNRTISNLINLSAKRLIIPAGTGLTVNKKIFTTGNTGSIYICSSSTVANGSFIFPNNTSAVNATVEMYSKAFYDPAGGTNSKYHWQYFGIPLTSIAASPTFDGSYVRSWDETGTTMYNHWVSLTNSSVLSPFYGYEITQLNPVTILFQGQLVNTDFNSGAMSKTTGALFPGQHIFANPYTAAINIAQLTFGTGTDATAYLFSTGTYNQWSGQTGSFGTNPGQYISVPKFTAGQNGLPSQIPSMQGVLVTALTAGSTATFGISYNSVVTYNTDLQRVGKDKSISLPSGLISTLIELTGSRFSDKMWLFSVPGCTQNFDNGWDGKKLIGSALAPQLYAMEPDGIYQVNSVDDINNTYLGFQPGEDSIYTFTFTHQNLGLKYTNVYLVDSVAHQTVDITASGTQYTFLSLPADTIIKRFKIVTSPEISTNVTAPGTTNSQLKVFSSKHSVFIDNPSDYQGSLSLYDISGRLIREYNFTANGVTTIQTDLIPGSYLIKAMTRYEKVTKKLIL